MIAWLTGSRLYGWIAGALAVVGGVLAIYFRGKNAGEKKVEAEVAKRDVEEIKEHAETVREVANVQSNVVRMPDSAVRERLRERWTRSD